MSKGPKNVFPEWVNLADTARIETSDSQSSAGNADRNRNEWIGVERRIKLHKDMIRLSSTDTALLEGGDWLDVQQIANIEITSEDREYPIEFAFDFGKSP